MDWRPWKFVVTRPVEELCQSDVNLIGDRRRQIKDEKDPSRVNRLARHADTGGPGLLPR